MRCLLSAALLAIVVLTFSPNLAAQGCANFSVQGTYCLTCNGWIDLSKIVPTFPAGYVPASYVGVVKLDGSGHGTGGLTANCGGQSLSLEFVDLTYTVNDNCTLESTYSVKVKELGITLAQDKRIMVIIPGGQTLELKGLNIGKGPGDEITPCEMKRMFTYPFLVGW